ncbi:unnamed protein product [Meloidogyne enterolobii]|uniref:Uncharacterized protein n=1 Tax=Meloidogyne enterolobii TaxID=390850 RepID=A0ACB0YIB0_MELEN
MLTNSKNNPEKDPVIFWYNGGPGCSSLLGLFTELGPYLLNKDGSKLIENPHSWNNNASVVFIESPAGVGFSYATDGNVATNDNIAADDNYLAIKQFFKKYPKFLKNDVYITGESYAGIYLPMLTSLIVKGMSKFKINLKGLAIGNPYLNKKLDYESTLIYAYGHGIVDEELWQSVKKDCCRGCIGTVIILMSSITVLARDVRKNIVFCFVTGFQKPFGVRIGKSTGTDFGCHDPFLSYVSSLHHPSSSLSIILKV